MNCLRLRAPALLLCVAALSGCPPSWSPAFDAESTGWLMNVWGTSATNVYAVGGQTSAGRVVRFDGSGWTEVELGVQAPLLNWVFGFAPDDVFIVGDRGTILHWDGATWTRQPTPITVDPVWGVWGAAPNDVWAVGGSGTGSGEAFILHYDGAEWTRAELPELQTENVFAFFKVWGTDASNVLVVGQNGVALRWNGARWTEEVTGARDDLISVWGSAPDRIVAAGGRANALVSVYDGRQWRTENLAPRPGLNGVWMHAREAPWLVGAEGSVLRLELESMTVQEEEVETELDLHSVFGVDGRLFAVGGNLTSGFGSFRGVALTREYDGP